jgi:hypothetical protein
MEEYYEEMQWFAEEVMNRLNLHKHKRGFGVESTAIHN